MKYFVPALLAASLMSAPAFAGDNIANCEIVVQVPIEAEAQPDNQNSVEEKSAQIATFLPAGDFIFSVFGDKPHLTEINGKPIRAVMCTRTSVVPSEFDLKMIRTGIPLYLSPDFDAKKSPFMGISRADAGYVYDYVGPDLSKDDLELLKLRMKALNDVKAINDIKE